MACHGAGRHRRRRARHLIPAGQYDAVLIDEGHDFRPNGSSSWCRWSTRRPIPCWCSTTTPNPSTTRAGKSDFSFKSVGIQAQGRTTILKVNYRNTQRNPGFRRQFAGELLQAERRRRRRRAAPGAHFRRAPRRQRRDCRQAAQPARRGVDRRPAQGRARRRHALARHGRALPALRPVCKTVNRTCSAVPASPDLEEGHPLQRQAGHGQAAAVPQQQGPGISPGRHPRTGPGRNHRRRGSPPALCGHDPGHGEAAGHRRLNPTPRAIFSDPL
jgi:hypothetical protein